MSKNKCAIIETLKYLEENTDEEHGATAAELLSHLAESGIEIGRKSLYDTINTLADSGVSIAQPKGRSAEYRLLDRKFEVPELKAIIDSVAAATFLSEKKSKAIIEKLKTLTSRQNAEELEEVILYGATVHTQNERLYYNIDGILQSIRQGKQISFAYVDYNIKKERVPRHNGKRYEVSPLAMAVQNDRYYLLADSKRVEGITHFRIDRMESVVLSKKIRSVKKIEGMDVSKYVKEHFQMYASAPIEVAVRFPSVLAGVVIDRFGADVSLIEDGKSHFILRTEVRSKETFFSWLFTFSTDAVILSPEPLKEEYSELLLEVYLAHNPTNGKNYRKKSFEDTTKF